MPELFLPKLNIVPPHSCNADDEPLSPAGRLFVHPEMNTIIHVAIGAENCIHLDTLKAILKEVFLDKHPRFSSLLVREGGRDYWRRTHVDIDRHVVLVDTPAGERDSDRFVNDYVAKLSVSMPLGSDKPPWEVHFMSEHRCAVFRLHHALGDGMSLMALLLGGCRNVNDQSPVFSPASSPVQIQTKKHANKGGLLRRFFAALKHALFSFMFCLEFLLRSMIVGDHRNAVSGGVGVHLWPRKLATAKFLINDMKTVKNAIPNATINDVLFGVISAGLAKYLDHRCETRLEKGVRMTGVAMINLRRQTGQQELSEMMRRDSKARWGNKFGMLLLPVNCYKTVEDPLDYVVESKAMIDAKKRSIESHFSYLLGNLLMSFLGPKFAFTTYYKTLCNTSFTISNMMGPQEKIAICGNPIKFMRVSTTSLPHALTMHMLSYAGRAEMQIMAARDIVPDPEFLARCFEDSLHEIKESALLRVGHRRM